MILMREISPEIRWRGTVVESNTTPSTRKRTRMSWPLGSKWTSDTPAAHGVGDHGVHELHDRRLVGRLAQLDHLGLVRSPPRPRVTEPASVPSCSISASMCSGEATARRTS